MLRLAVLSLLAFAPAASAQTADVLEEITTFLERLRQEGGPVTRTYDLTKLVKSRPNLNTVEKVILALESEGALAKPAPSRDPVEQVQIAPGNKLVIRGAPAVHSGVESLLIRMNDPGYKDRTARGLFAVPAVAVRPGGLPPVPQLAMPPSAPQKQKK